MPATSLSSLGLDRMRTEELGELSENQRRQLAYWPRIAFFASTKSTYTWEPGDGKLAPLLTFDLVAGAPEPPGLTDRAAALVDSCRDLLGVKVEIVAIVNGKVIFDTRVG